jgi:hypothetical protein
MMPGHRAAGYQKPFRGGCAWWFRRRGADRVTTRLPGDCQISSRQYRTTRSCKETTSTTLDALLQTFGPTSWFREFRKMVVGETIETDEGKKVPAPNSVAHWANSKGVNVMAAEGLHNKLRRVFNLPYVNEKPAVDSVAEVINALESGQHIVLSFGDHESDLDYLLVSNLLSRRIRAAWERRTNSYRTKGESEPRSLVIVVEEAHKLLNPTMASQTTFSTIARELRKYYVTLLIVDQRPSQIYDEVMSQLGTRISGWLGDEDDIRAVLTGLAGREALRGMLARLHPECAARLVPMLLPVPVGYDDQFGKSC